MQVVTERQLVNRLPLVSLTSVAMAYKRFDGLCCPRVQKKHKLLHDVETFRLGMHIAESCLPVPESADAVKRPGYAMNPWSSRLHSFKRFRL